MGDLLETEMGDLLKTNMGDLFETDMGDLCGMSISDGSSLVTIIYVFILNTIFNSAFRTTGTGSTRTFTVLSFRTRSSRIGFPPSTFFGKHLLTIR